MTLPMKLTCCFSHSVRYAAAAWGDSLNGYIKRQASQDIFDPKRGLVVTYRSGRSYNEDTAVEVCVECRKCFLEEVPTALDIR
jgi:hypothetical protein